MNIANLVEDIACLTIVDIGTRPLADIEISNRERIHLLQLLSDLETLLALFERAIILALTGIDLPGDRKQFGRHGCLSPAERGESAADPIQRQRKFAAEFVNIVDPATCLRLVVAILQL